MMNLDISKKIGDFLINQKITNQGLMSGKAGVSIFLHLLSKNLSDEKYAIHADLLIDEIYENITSNIDFYDGTLGIGWSIEYLIQNGFSEGDTDEILEDIDDNIYRKLSEPNRISIGLKQGLVGYLQYLIMRLKNRNISQNISKNINVELFKLTINRISQEVPSQLINLTRDIRFYLFDDIHTLFLSIISAYDLNIYNEKIMITLKQWESYWISYIPYIHFHRLYLALNLFQVNQILKSEKTDKHLRMLLYSIDVNELRKEVYMDKIASIGFGYLGQISILNKSIELLNPTYPNYDLLFSLKLEMLKLCNGKLLVKFDEILADSKEKQDCELGIADGWAGIGLLLLETDIFNKSK